MAKEKKNKEKGSPLANPLDYAPKYKAYNKDADLNHQVASKGYIPFLFWWPLVRRPNSKFGRKCANQGLILTILTCVFAIITVILAFTAQGGIGEYPWWEVAAVAFGIIIVGFTVNGLLSTSEGNFTQVPFFGGITLIKEEKKRANPYR